MSQRQLTEGNSLYRVVALAAKKTTVIPPLSVEQRKLIRGYASADLSLKLVKWAYICTIHGLWVPFSTRRQTKK